MATPLLRGIALVLLMGSAIGRADDPPPALLPGTTVQLPTFGISIDAEGMLEARTFRDYSGRLLRERLAAARSAKPGDLWAGSSLRKVSLVRLEKALAADIAAGTPIDPALMNLAGLVRLQYVFCFPTEAGAAGDIVLAGPAEPFAADAAGRAISLKSGRPVLRLDDLAVALRAFPPDSHERPFLGCTIDPPAEGLARLVEFQKTVPRTVRMHQRQAVAAHMAQGIADSLGSSEIRVFGISNRTHFAHVLIEADFRMKRIGIGAEPPPIKMATFIGSLDGPPPATLQRWWFTPNYRCLRLADDRLAAELIGQGVQLLTEDKHIATDGSLAAGGAPPSKASERFAESFTRQYEKIAAASPVYAQLRGLMDLSMLAALLRRHDYYGRSGWAPGVLADETLFPVETLPEPKRAPCAVNALWKGNRLLAPAGGVSIRPDEALDDANLLSDEQGAVRRKRDEVRLPSNPNQWWWD